MTALSAVSLKPNTTRLSGSKGSAGLPPEVAQPASVPARSSAAHSLLVLATRLAFNPCLLLAVAFGGFVVQELTDEIFQHTADCVSFKVSPPFRLTVSPPGERPMYCSPSRPEVR